MWHKPLCLGDIHTPLASLEVTEGRVSLYYTVISLVCFNKYWLVLRVRHPLRFAPLRGEDKYPRMLMVLGLMENLFDEP